MRHLALIVLGDRRKNTTAVRLSTCRQLVLGGIRSTAEYVNDIAEVCMNGTIDEVTEKRSTNCRRQ
jgi:hypothetical protein